MHVLAEDDHPLVGRHPAVHHGGDHVDEALPGQVVRAEVVLRAHPGRIHAGPVAADADVDEGRLRPQLRPDPQLPGTARRIGLGDPPGEFLHQLLAGPAQVVQLFAGGDAEPLQVAFGQLQRVPVAPARLLLLAAVAERAARERAVLVEVAVGVGLDHGRALTRADVREHLVHHQLDREGVLAVHPPAGDAEAEAADAQPRIGGGLVVRGRHGVVVVLDEEDDRQLPGGREVQRLQGRADVAGSVAEVGDRDRVGAGELVRHRETGGERDGAADDGVGAHRAGLLPLQVHRPAPAAAETVREARDLRQRAVQHRDRLGAPRGPDLEPVGLHGVQRLGQELVVAAVRAVDLVGHGERDRRADRAGLLSDRRVRRAVDQLLAGQVEHLLLEGPDQVHLHRHRLQHGRIGRVPIRLTGPEFVPGGRGLQRLDCRHTVLPPRYTRPHPCDDYG